MTWQLSNGTREELPWEQNAVEVPAEGSPLTESEGEVGFDEQILCQHFERQGFKDWSDGSNARKDLYIIYNINSSCHSPCLLERVGRCLEGCRIYMDLLVLSWPVLGCLGAVWGRFWLAVGRWPRWEQDLPEPEGNPWTFIAELPTDASDGEDGVNPPLPFFLKNANRKSMKKMFRFSWSSEWYTFFWAWRGLKWQETHFTTAQCHVKEADVDVLKEDFMPLEPIARVAPQVTWQFSPSVFLVRIQD